MTSWGGRKVTSRAKLMVKKGNHKDPYEEAWRRHDEGVEGVTGKARAAERPGRWWSNSGTSAYLLGSVTSSCLSFLIGKKGTGIAPLCPVIMSRMRCLRESSLPGGCPVFSLVLTGTPEQVLFAAGFRKGTEGGGMTRAEPRGTGSVFLPRNPERVFPGGVSQKGTQKFQFPFSSPLPPLNPPTSICRQCTVTVTVCMGLSTARRF